MNLVPKLRNLAQQVEAGADLRAAARGSALRRLAALIEVGREEDADAALRSVAPAGQNRLGRRLDFLLKRPVPADPFTGPDEAA